MPARPGSVRGWCDTCFCIRDVQRSIAVIGIFTLGCAITEIMHGISVFTGINEKYSDFEVKGSSKEQITYQLYIALFAMDFFLAFFSVLLLYGNERTDLSRGRRFLIPWAVLIPFFVIYESAVNIYYFYNQFNNKYEGPLKEGHYLGFVIVPLVYWIIKDILAIIAFVFVVLRIQALTPIVEYVEPPYNPGCGCQGPSPPISLPTPVNFGGCSSGACSRPAAPQPVYGYHYNGHSAQVGQKGFTTSVYNNGR